QMLFAEWKRQLPAACRGRVAAEVGRWTDATLPHLYLATSAAPLRPVPFSRLTLTAQLEVLSQPVARSWDLCTPLNSFLIPWRQRAQGGKLQVTPWPSRAANWLSGRAYAERFVKAASVPPMRGTKTQDAVELARAVQADFIRIRLQPEYLYPLLWS